MVTSARVAVTLSLLALLAAPVAASIADPPGGTPILMWVGLDSKVKLQNNMGCDFSFVAFSDDPDVVEVTPASGTLVKGATITLNGLKAGSAMVTIMSMEGSCPDATHLYPTTVLGNFQQVEKDFGSLVNDVRKDFKLGIKFEHKFFADTLKDLNVQYKDGALDDDGLQDGFHLAATNLRKGITLQAEAAYDAVVGGGTQMLIDHGAVYGDAPMSLFAGGCGHFDKFQDSTCGEFSKFHNLFDKASKKGIQAFEKSGAPTFGQWCTLAPLYSGGPFYEDQAGAFDALETLAGPFTITIRPATSPQGDNGRLLVSGQADSALDGQFEATLTREENDQPPVVTTLTPSVVDDEWSVEFSGLLEGSYVLETGYDKDSFRVPVHIHIPFQGDDAAPHGGG